MNVHLGLRECIFAVLTVLIPRLALQALIPSRLDAQYAPKSDYGLGPANCFNSTLTATGLDIIFVHGLGSNPDTTWQRLVESKSHDDSGDPSLESRYVNWVTDFFCEDLPPHVQKNTRLFFYNYDSYWQRDAIQERRTRLGQELFQEVSSLAVKTPERHFILVGHSYGGLVIKDAIIQAQIFHPHRVVNIFQQIKAAVFLGTPHRGSASALQGARVAQVLRLFGLGTFPEIVEAVRYDSVELQDMHRRFEATSDHLKIVNFFEKRETARASCWGFCSGLVVKEQSATMDRPNAELIGLNTDHSGLNKFGERNSNYKKLRNKLIELAEATLGDAWMSHSVYSVPESTDSMYTERRDLSKALEAKLGKELEESTKIKHAVAIDGIGGAGKTQLALRYAEAHRLQYDTILWIDAGSAGTIKASFYRCARDLRLSVEPDRTTTGYQVSLKDDPAVHIVLTWLQNRNQLHGEWLVILDNADDFDGGVRDIIPSGVRGSVILTSRDKECVEILPPGAQQLTVNIMTPPESSSLLLRHLNLNTTEVPQDIQEVSLSICESLQHLPLAVRLAGAHTRSHCLKSASPEDDRYSGIYIDPKGCLEQYLRNYQRHRDRLLKDEISKRLSSYKFTIWTVWDSSLDAVDKMSSFPSRLLLTFLAHMDHTNIPEYIFYLAAGGLVSEPALASDVPQWLLELVSLDENGRWDRFTYDQTLQPLRLFGLISDSRGDFPGVAMHSLVQWRAKIDNPSGANYSWTLYHASFMAAASMQALAEPRHVLFRWQIVPHLPPPKELLSLEGGAIGLMCGIIGIMYRECTRLKEAEELIVHSIDKANMALGSEHPDTLAQKAGLALVWYHNCQYEEAERLLERVGEAQEAVLGAENAETLSVKILLALSLWRQGQYNNAENLLVYILEVFNSTLGPDHSHSLSTRAHLASVLFERGNWKRAEELLIPPHEWQERLAGVVHPLVILSMEHFAASLSQQRRLADAEECLAYVLETKRRVYGPEDPQTLETMVALGSILTKEGRYAEAEVMTADLLEMQKKVFGREHPNILTSMNSLASIFYHQERLTDALEMMVNVMETQKRVLGAEHPKMIRTMYNLALILFSQGQQTEGQRLLAHVVEMERKLFGEGHPETIAGMKDLIFMFTTQGRWLDADELLTRVFGSDSSDDLAFIREQYKKILRLDAIKIKL
ncbi:hypothetical protein BDV30DRAFT_241947 [Aspergillus minisclerotigenes]|uniref:GPI inositol-deacylase n=1 Tax=Aspergillus minisclerotigenes TaxID=656917 RepID=A0A5N6IUQ5_9EURO|nr:hypothetical protein BDV30DRAFT_241947 [Aspergillus minisclerotigenes]